MGDLLPIQGRLAVEGKVPDRLPRRKPCCFDAKEPARGVAGRDFSLQDRGEVLLVRPPVRSGLVAEVFEGVPNVGALRARARNSMCFRVSLVSVMPRPRS